MKRLNPLHYRVRHQKGVVTIQVLVDGAWKAFSLTPGRARLMQQTLAAAATRAAWKPHWLESAKERHANG